MFKWLNKTGVESDHGFVVQSVDRLTVEYREGKRKVSVYVERGYAPGNTPCVIIESTAFERWDDDSACTVLSPEKQAEMLLNFTEAMKFQGIDVVVPPPVSWSSDS
jgi:hypothetical protein